MFKKRDSKKLEGLGLVLFKEVKDALKAEKVLKLTGFKAKLCAPPPALRKGCDLALEVELIEEVVIKRAFKENGVAYDSIVCLNDENLKPLEVVKVTDFGEALMVKAGNMKLTFNKTSGVILNISGGGCPDVPYLHHEFLGKKLNEVSPPSELGFTLCALMLNRAFEESLHLWSIQQESGEV